MVNNLNDGMIWGLLPILLFSLHFDTPQIGIITAIYPGVWGIGQLFTGKMADIYAPKALLFWGMYYRESLFWRFHLSSIFISWLRWRRCWGSERPWCTPLFCRLLPVLPCHNNGRKVSGCSDCGAIPGMLFGAIISGITADLFGVEYAIALIGLITVGISFSG